MLRCRTRISSGSSIASFLEDVKPDFADDLLKYTPEQITEFFRHDAILKLAVEDPRWMAVLTDAREYLEADEEPATVH